MQLLQFSISILDLLSNGSNYEARILEISHGLKFWSFILDQVWNLNPW